MNAPMFENKYLAHALGGYQGYKYLNNEPALKNAIKNGHRFFEVDLRVTNDGHLLPTHGWSEEICPVIGLEYSPEFENMTKELFLKQTVHGMPTMDTELLYQYMKRYPDFYWEIDLHTIPKEEAIRAVRALLSDFHNDTALFDRFLVQANSPEMFEGIDSVYHFKYYQLFIRKDVTPEGLAEAAEYCNKNGFCSVALSAKDAKPENIDFLHGKGLQILVYSVDDQKKADRIASYGADTICTNLLSPRGDRILQFKKHPYVKKMRRVKNKLAGILK